MIGYAAAWNTLCIRAIGRSVGFPRRQCFAVLNQQIVMFAFVIGVQQNGKAAAILAWFSTGLPCELSRIVAQ